MRNVNVGVLGHVDSGKTSLVAALSTTLSTAALDKHPQSRERGITLDLGFSAFTVPLPSELLASPSDDGQQHPSDDTHRLQFTLVDCPGHASLIRTIIGGAQIIDTMILVIDVTKGIQAQTAECLVVGEIAAKQLVVALNKIDLLPEELRPKAVKRATKLLHQTLALTKFGKATVIPVAAKPERLGIEDLKAWLVDSVVQQHKQQQQQQQPAPTAAEQRPFLFAIDHCFAIKGQGTVMTGTVLQGTCSVNDSIELPALKQARLVKSMQAFHRPVERVEAGDRAGLCVTQLNPSAIERGLAAAPGSVPTFAAAIAAVDKVRFYDRDVASRQKYHVVVGHATVMAEAAFFGTPDGTGSSLAAHLKAAISFLHAIAQHRPMQPFDWQAEYLYQEQLAGLEGRPLSAPAQAAAATQQDDAQHHGPQWALLRFDQPLTAPQDSVIIGARLDVEASGDSCRLAFYGRLVALLPAGSPQELQQLQVFKVKERQGSITRVAPDACSAVCKGLFKRESDISFFEGARVVTGRGEVGTIQGKFGTTGKFKVDFPPPGLQQQQSSSDSVQAVGTDCSHAARAGSSSSSSRQRSAADNVLTLRFKRFLFDPDAKKKLRQ